MFAVIATGGKQYKVAVGDVLAVEKLEADVDGEVAFPVLMVVTDDNKVTAGPDAAKAVVNGTVVEHFKGKKLRVFKYRNKTGYRRKQGHRQPLTRVRITSINA